jgi:hypothetical protein
MSDYHSIIAQAVSQLPINTVEARLKLYDHARTALMRQLEQEPRRIFGREQRALDKAIRQVEKSSPQYKSTSTALLIVSMFFLHKLWVLDCTAMSTYWVVARLPKAS